MKLGKFPYGCIALAGFVPGLLWGCAGHQRSISAPTATVPMKGSVPSVPKPKSGSELRVMTFNLRVRTILDGPNIWDRRRDSLVQRVRSFDPDLLGTQEGLDTMETFLREQLDDYTFFGAGRSDGKRLGEMTGVFFKTARFDQLDGGNFWLSPTPEKAGSRGWGAVFPRMVTWMKLRPRDGGQPFCWFNTHFDAFSGRARAESARLMRDHMAHIAGIMPCIVTGDFNAPPGSTPYRTLLAEHQPPSTSLHDVFRAANPVANRNEGTVHFFTGWRGGRRMDWILASGRFQTIDAKIDHTRGPRGYPSDHFPVTATLLVPPPQRKCR